MVRHNVVSSNLSNVYKARRLDILEKYINFCNQTGGINKNTVFSITNIEAFLKQQVSKNKHLIQTHLTQILRSLSIQSEKNVQRLLTTSDFQLKNHPTLHKFHKPSKSITSKQKNSDLSFLKVSEFQDIIKMHNTAKQHSASLCRSLLQASLGVRVQNTFNLSENTQLISALCLSCNPPHIPLCRFPTINCFRQIKFLSSKTGSHVCYIPYQIIPCFNFLLSSHSSNNTSTALHNYNHFLTTNFQCTSHACRRFLTNLHDSTRINSNTGAWSSPANQRFYLHNNLNKIISLHHIFLSCPLNNC